VCAVMGPAKCFMAVGTWGITGRLVKLDHHVAVAA